ncbi:acyl carrier protein [Vagococcus sp. PNs007]|uniref:Acyl carrier protein n=1 Tax=Vagococcus proximus TaxID=2991417 RepID=A0ABT5X0A9_9ENTE|nr:acyl carrier protein [Vagococcus proximus]MDF0479337.1 acyl carrier protein [Vagococcus proximus]
MENKIKLNEIFKRTFNIKDEELDFLFNKENVTNWDSLGHITLVSEIENDFEVMMETEDILALNSFDDAIKILEKNEISF